MLNLATPKNSVRPVVKKARAVVTPAVRIVGPMVSEVCSKVVDESL